jgi:hypothetical protein
MQACKNGTVPHRPSPQSQAGRGKEWPASIIVGNTYLNDPSTCLGVLKDELILLTQPCLVDTIWLYFLSQLIIALIKTRDNSLDKKIHTHWFFHGYPQGEAINYSGCRTTKTCRKRGRVAALFLCKSRTRCARQQRGTAPGLMCTRGRVCHPMASPHGVRELLRSVFLPAITGATWNRYLSLSF